MTIRITWKRALLAIAGLILAAMLFAWSGLFQIAASSGHWKITDWFLHWTMQNSVRTYSSFQTPADVRDDIALVSAAGHFRQSCATCHGAPGLAPSPEMQSATPPAPNLATTVSHYGDAELFWILKHGIKYTGMPAWPTLERPDEVRRMVGFLRRLPRMTAREFAALTDAQGGEEMTGLRPGLLASCTGCHGSDGLGRGQADIPIIAGQKPRALAQALRAYVSGERASGIMQVAATGLDQTEIQALARHFAAMPGLVDAPLAATHPLITQGLPRKQLPACVDCHRPGKTAPLIGGQRATFIADRLHAWQGDKTVIDAQKPDDPMPVIARRIPKKEIEPLARAISSSTGR